MVNRFHWDRLSYEISRQYDYSDLTQDENFIPNNGRRDEEALANVVDSSYWWPVLVARKTNGVKAWNISSEWSERNSGASGR